MFNIVFFSFYYRYTNLLINRINIMHKDLITLPTSSNMEGDKSQKTRCFASTSLPIPSGCYSTFSPENQQIRSLDMLMVHWQISHSTWDVTPGQLFEEMSWLMFLRLTWSAWRKLVRNGLWLPDSSIMTFLFLRWGSPAIVPSNTNLLKYSWIKQTDKNKIS